jgi:hypothetical protein
MRGVFVFAAIAVGLLCATTTSAQISTVINYPSADVMGHREFQINQGFTSKTPNLNTSYVQSTNYLVGLFDRLEFAGNADWVGNHSFGVKATLYRSKDETFSFGTGLQNMRKLDGDPFACVRKSCGNWNFHAGWVRDASSYGTLGIDTMLNPRLGASYEYGSGPTGASAMMLYYNLTDGFQLQGFVTRPNDTTVDATHNFVLSYTLRF